MGDLRCETRKVDIQSLNLMRVDDLAVADGLVFLLDTTSESGWLAVVKVDGSVTQRAVEVNSLPFNGVSAAGGRVIVSGGIQGLQSFDYDLNDGSLQHSKNVSLG